ncbi:antioxidant, AhpC/TSA family [gut metagenome]|uniref:Antioxidant, AhpC/TSA family n=1 Tax=gut metagenome TaxID=749906 RepID=J9FXP7_9ZZZZ
MPVRHLHSPSAFFVFSFSMRKFYSSLLLLATLWTVAACGPGKDRARFEGSLKNINNAEFYVYSEDGAFEGVDTIRIEDGDFLYERKLTEPALLTLLYPNYTQAYIIAEPGKTVRMKGDAAQIGVAEISGTDENNLLTEFRQEQLKGPESNHRLAAAQFIRTHAESMAAVAVFRMFFLQPSKDSSLSLQMLDILYKAQPKNHAVRYLNDFARPLFLNGVGKPLPEFTAETLVGKKVSSADYRGKKLVIACLSTWPGESKVFMHDLHQKLKQAKGNWECLIVSMDLDRNVLRRTLENDSIPYPIVCERKAFNSPLAQRLGLRYVPSLMVVDAEGIIRQRDVQKVADVKW